MTNFSGVFLAAGLVLGELAAHAGEVVSYLDFDPVAGTFSNAEVRCEVVTDTTLTLADGGWYAVAGDVTLHPGAPLAVVGTAHLVLCDGASLTIESIPELKPALSVTNGATLTVYGQADGSGRLTAKGGLKGAGIGGGNQESCGTVVLNGGVVTAAGGDGAAGIGGGYGGGGGKIRINGGVVAASGGEYGAGIGGGHRGGPDEVTICGGIVAALGGRTGAGVGGGWFGKGGTVSVSGGTVTALGGTGGAGIGGGYAAKDGFSFHRGEDVEIIAGAVGEDANAVRIDWKGTSGPFALPRFAAEYARFEFDAGVPNIVLDEEKARPVLKRLAISDEASDSVSVTVDNVVVGLSYGLGVAASPAASSFVVNAWTLAESEKPLELSAPKSGSALFYRVMAR